MFEVTLQVIEDSMKIKDTFYLMGNILTEVCEPLRIGASYICSTSKESLLTIYLLQDSTNARFQLNIKIESENAEELMSNLSKISSMLKQNNIHITLVNNTFKSL
ncbi:hypothetical protein DFR86_09490 [Acidianus sulfidivorans JP7]|uniref:Uncharacterized protein n=1 Tax=Acidianus sulfidivorans JP7 TaxID=619593 RepID=A0A2U9IP15_9CREN|nr:hypothetical protein [Acidianus sulfidivorans]AWR97755.1 hypothetical protein DFR86_09490 [Acidianus sulfidivorans JP7]